jgi:hypothetical protein
VYKCLFFLRFQWIKCIKLVERIISFVVYSFFSVHGNYKCTKNLFKTIVDLSENYSTSTLGDCKCVRYFLSEMELSYLSEYAQIWFHDYLIIWFYIENAKYKSILIDKVSIRLISSIFPKINRLVNRIKHLLLHTFFLKYHSCIKIELIHEWSFMSLIYQESLIFF